MAHLEPVVVEFTVEGSLHIKKIKTLEDILPEIVHKAVESLNSQFSKLSQKTIEVLLSVLSVTITLFLFIIY